MCLGKSKPLVLSAVQAIDVFIFLLGGSSSGGLLENMVRGYCNVHIYLLLL